MTVASAPSLGQPWKRNPLRGLDPVGKPGDAEGRRAAERLRPSLLLSRFRCSAGRRPEPEPRGTRGKLNIRRAQWWLLVCYAFTQPPAPLGSGLVGEIRVAAAGKRSDPKRKSEKQGEQKKRHEWNKETSQKACEEIGTRSWERKITFIK